MAALEGDRVGCCTGSWVLSQAGLTEAQRRHPISGIAHAVYRPARRSVDPPPTKGDALTNADSCLYSALQSFAVRTMSKASMHVENKAATPSTLSVKPTTSAIPYHRADGVQNSILKYSGLRQPSLIKSKTRRLRETEDCASEVGNAAEDYSSAWKAAPLSPLCPHWQG
jgi:hypothetical protein